MSAGCEAAIIAANAANLDRLAAECYRIAAEHGFHDQPNPLPQSLCLIHSEVSEALEAHRDDVMLSYREDGKPEGVLSELADVLIRTLDTWREIAPGTSISGVVAMKMAYNEKRPVGHGRVRL